MSGAVESQDEGEVMEEIGNRPGWRRHCILCLRHAAASLGASCGAGSKSHPWVAHTCRRFLSACMSLRAFGPRRLMRNGHNDQFFPQFELSPFIFSTWFFDPAPPA